MDPTETRAREHLLSRGFADLIFEPDGNIPPDFLVAGRIAVEVSRLSQRVESGGGVESLEELAIPLIDRIQALAATFGPPVDESWLLTLEFERPLPRWRHLSERVKAFLLEVRALGRGQGLEAQIHPNLRIEATPKSPIQDEMFHLALIHDNDAGGWVLDELANSLRHVLEEKTSKIAPFVNRYPEWWLLLLDHVNYARQSSTDIQVTVPPPWRRLVLVDPTSPSFAIDLGGSA
jgi:hypothetical protein